MNCFRYISSLWQPERIVKTACGLNSDWSNLCTGKGKRRPPHAGTACQKHSVYFKRQQHEVSPYHYHTIKPSNNNRTAGLDVFCTVDRSNVGLSVGLPIGADYNRRVSINQNNRLSYRVFPPYHRNKKATDMPLVFRLCAKIKHYMPGRRLVSNKDSTQPPF